jgi:hypothetical protein
MAGVWRRKFRCCCKICISPLPSLVCGLGSRHVCCSYISKYLSSACSGRHVSRREHIEYHFMFGSSLHVNFTHPVHSCVCRVYTGHAICPILGAHVFPSIPPSSKKHLPPSITCPHGDSIHFIRRQGCSTSSQKG